MRAGVGKTDPLPVFMDEAFSFRMPVVVRPGIDMPDQRLHHSAPLQFETTDFAPITGTLGLPTARMFIQGNGRFIFIATDVTP